MDSLTAENSIFLNNNKYDAVKVEKVHRNCCFVGDVAPYGHLIWTRNLAYMRLLAPEVADRSRPLGVVAAWSSRSVVELRAT